MDIIYTVAALVIYLLGIVTGMYYSSQIEKDIDKRTKR